jgi:hypothetical protein
VGISHGCAYPRGGQAHGGQSCRWCNLSFWKSCGFLSPARASSEFWKPGCARHMIGSPGRDLGVEVMGGHCSADPVDSYLGKRWGLACSKIEK